MKLGNMVRPRRADHSRLDRDHKSHVSIRRELYGSQDLTMHVIRLKGPWQYELSAIAKQGNISLPANWASVVPPESPSSQSVTMSRKFHAPTGLTPDQSVRLRWINIPDAVARLNGKPLSVDSASSAESGEQADITHLLQRFNILEITVCLSSHDECYGQVELHIVSATSNTQRDDR